MDGAVPGGGVQFGVQCKWGALSGSRDSSHPGRKPVESGWGRHAPRSQKDTRIHVLGWLRGRFGDLDRPSHDVSLEPARFEGI